MEQNQYGFFTGKPGEYVLTEIPAVGSYWYYYGNEKITVRVDQSGIDLCQADAPAGIALLKRERYGRSPWLVYIQAGDRTVNNFDLFAAKSIRIEFRPEKAVYRLEFGEFSVDVGRIDLRQPWIHKARLVFWSFWMIFAATGIVFVILKICAAKMLYVNDM